MFSCAVLENFAIGRKIVLPSKISTANPKFGLQVLTFQVGNFGLAVEIFDRRSRVGINIPTTGTFLTFDRVFQEYMKRLLGFYHQEENDTDPTTGSVAFWELSSFTILISREVICNKKFSHGSQTITKNNRLSPPISHPLEQREALAIWRQTIKESTFPEERARHSLAYWFVSKPDLNTITVILLF